MKLEKEFLLEEVKSYKVLSIKQPWAWLISQGYKDVENRKWATKVRGEILIHAGARLDHEGYDFVKNNFKDFDLPNKDEFEYGGLVGICNITDCRQNFSSRWFFGPHGFVIEDARPLEFIPLKGQLKFFNFSGDILAKGY